MSIAESVMADASQTGVRPLSLDQVQRGKPQAHKWAVAGTVGASTRTDQAVFYALLADTAKDSTHDLVTPTAGVSGWSASTIARYIADNPSPLINIHFTGASTDSLLAEGALEFVRKTPDGAVQSELIFLSRFRHEMTQIQKILSVPVNSEILDGYTWLRVLTAEATPTANSYNATFSFGATLDKRAEVPQARAGVVAPARPG
jgi:hypothetical protein